MKAFRAFTLAMLLGAVLAVGPAEVTAMVPSYWESAAQSCEQTGGDVWEDGRCGGGITFDNCYESNWAAVCEDYCLAGALDMQGDGPPYYCTCNPCTGG
jgi:hypothetical protein